MVPAIDAQLNHPDPSGRERLDEITAPRSSSVVPAVISTRANSPARHGRYRRGGLCPSTRATSYTPTAPMSSSPR
ncbi:hypothetical protein NKH18_03270 [Streptomyces sp. M10(2022)]